MRNIKLTITFDGTNFKGFQTQENNKSIKNKRTVEETLKNVLEKAFNEKIKIVGCSRTDTGVHALNYVLNFNTSSKVPSNKIKRILNDLLSEKKLSIGYHPSEIYVKKAEEVEKKFHARFNAKRKSYIYKIFNVLDLEEYLETENKNKTDDTKLEKKIESDNRAKKNNNGFLFEQSNYKLFVAEKLDIKEMKKATKFLIGKNNFKAFKTSSQEDKKLEEADKNCFARKVFSIDIIKKKDEITIRITGDGFLYNMCRIIVGTILEVGTGKRNAQELKEILKSKDRRKAGFLAPAHALYLEEIFY